MVNLKQLKENTETDDIIFNYNEKHYFIFFFGKVYNAGEYGKESEDKEFSSFEEMADNWIIQGKPLKDIISEIELL